ncbi:hypothetical protein AOQ84DRAFT_364784 [Glonium stellatum]|uniref:Uncharacterized protein n=1 Tax=Glonium stellatum TaxID=574774 RepID=A0A8E2EZA0_9PEZI|nr:hypothetical protein AOQ84DRAFT_364784 [Glonium stellatum]
MPSNAADQDSAGSNLGSRNSASIGKSDYAMIKDAGFHSMNEFMLSYGLLDLCAPSRTDSSQLGLLVSKSVRMEDHDDHGETNAILDGMRKIDEQQAKGKDK